ncbi:MAG TPA: four helix bundle suffix domain-containing protein [Chitinispirillaceae bacterium]|nr:four helix bundle suffix domain-containing protein [Chitinispirillaceae bacterium]
MANLIPKHGGYRKLKSFQISQLIYDITVRFCDRYIDRTLPMLVPQDPVLLRFKKLQCKTLAEVQMWVAQERKYCTDLPVQLLTDNANPVSGCQCRPLSSSCLAANGALSLLNLACHLLDRQVQRLADDFENEGGFTERLYPVRSEKRKESFKK